MEREDQIAMARRHVLQNERQVARQCQIIAGLKGTGSDTTIADDLLLRFGTAL